MHRRTVLSGSGVAVACALAGCLGNGFTGSDDDHDASTALAPDAVVEEDPRVDDPPHEIERPEEPDSLEDGDEWDDEYLGTSIETDPSLSFETLPVPRWAIVDTGFGDADFDEGDAYRVTAVTSEDEYHRYVDEDAIDETEYADDRTPADVHDALEAVDFNESFLVIVESGFGSGSVGHRWSRLEDDGEELTIHGSYTDPWMQTHDITDRTSVLRVEHPPDAVSFVRVRLTVSGERRVRFNSTEGVVTLEE